MTDDNFNALAGVVPDFTHCPYWGIGGRYLADPATGRRVPLNETMNPETLNPAQETEHVQPDHAAPLAQ